MIDIESLDMVELEYLRDACARRILRLRRTKNLPLPDLLRLLEDVKVTLQDQGKEWRSLERWQWIDGEIRFWLNPVRQDRYQSGWFSIDDLIAWARDEGPIVSATDADLLDDEQDLWSAYTPLAA